MLIIMPINHCFLTLAEVCSSITSEPANKGHRDDQIEGNLMSHVRPVSCLVQVPLLYERQHQECVVDSP
jgi:hypothetical protein